MKKTNKAFTLVELIVVITILTILGTIAFLSFQGYNASARNSVRTSDISAIKTSMELYKVNSGIYPNPTDGINITYTGALLWKQGTFGESVFSNLSNLNKLPLDPLFGNKYTYSLSNNKNEYQLSTIIESAGTSIKILQKKLMQIIINDLMYY